MPEPDDAIANGLLRHFQAQAASVAARLREAADDVERHAAKPQTNLNDMKPELAYRAAEITHDVAMAVANLRLDGLIRAAGDFDRYVREAAS